MTRSRPSPRSSRWRPLTGLDGKQAKPLSLFQFSQYFALRRKQFVLQSEARFGIKGPVTFISYRSKRRLCGAFLSGKCGGRKRSVRLRRKERDSGRSRCEARLRILTPKEEVGVSILSLHIGEQTANIYHARYSHDD